MEYVFGESKLTAIRHVPVSAICIHGESLTTAKTIEHGVVDRVRIFDVYASHLICSAFLVDVVDVAGSTSLKRSGDVCCVIYHLEEERKSAKCFWLLPSQCSFVSYQCSRD